MGMLKIEQTPYTHEQNGQTYYEYQLTKEQTIDLITGYRADLRIRINRRWQELEQATTPRLPQTYLEALRALADEVEAHEHTQQQLAIAEPKVQYLTSWLSVTCWLILQQPPKSLELNEKISLPIY